MKQAILTIFGVMLVGLLAAGCTSGGDDTTTSSETSAPPTTTTTVVETTTTTNPSAAADASCVTCHTNQATLQALAVEPVATETLSEGEG